MSWALLPAGLMFMGSGIAVWAAISAFGRRTVPGRFAFGWAQLAIALWGATAGLDLLVVSINERIAISQVQYFGIASLPVCWLLFAGAYTRRLDVRQRRMWLLWVIPILTVVAAFTNTSHHLLWREIVPSGPTNAIPIYVHGPAFWLDWVYANILLGLGTYWMLLALRHYPRQYRPQMLLLVTGMAAPWVGNFAYIFGLIPIKGLDATPLGFSVTGLCFAVGLFRYQLFELVPVARSLLFDNLGDPVFVLDPARYVLDMNTAARTLTGGRLPRPSAEREGGSTSGRRIEDVLPWWRELAWDEKPTTERPRIVKIEPGARSFEVVILAIVDDRREFAAWLVVIHDITVLVEAEATRLSLERRLLEQQHVESLTVLAGGLAHDFNNFLQAILGNAELARSQAASDSITRECLDTVITGAVRAIDVVAKMRAYAGERVEALRDVDLAALIGGMVDLLSYSAARGAMMLYEPPRESVLVHGDPTELRQVVLNLIVNATEAAGSGPCQIMVSAGVEELTADRLSQAIDRAGAATPAPPGRYAFIEVQDTGTGMDAATLARIFDPYFTTKADGRGLGLAAVQGIVRSHRGILHVTSEVGRGTTFRVWLPTPESSGDAARG